MKMKRFFAALAATAVSAASLATMSFSASAAGTVVATAEIMGQFGTYQYWGGESSTVTSNIAEIDGNAQYETSLTLSGDGTGSEEFLILRIYGTGETEDTTNFTKDQYPDLNITIDEIIIDGENFAFTNNDEAYQLSWYEGAGHVRIFLTETWGNVNGGNDLGLRDTAITEEIKVRFTVSGLYNDGTSNVTEDEPATDAPADDTTDAPADDTTDAPADDTTDAPSEDATDADTNSGSGDADADTDADTNTGSGDANDDADTNSGSGNNNSGSNNTGSTGGSTNEESAPTGVAGVGALLAAMTLAGAAAFATRKR